MGEGGRSESRDVIGKSCKVKSEVSERGIFRQKSLGDQERYVAIIIMIYEEQEINTFSFCFEVRSL